MAEDKEHYEKIDIPFYKTEIEPRLPEEILDFHVHVWQPDQYKINPFSDDVKGLKYMVFGSDYSFDQLFKDTSMMLPGKVYKSVCFGNPGPAVDPVKTNKYVRDGAAGNSSVYPLMVAGKGLLAAEQIEKEIIEGGFLGYKVFLNWFGNDYGSIGVDDMLGPVEMKIAQKYKLIVLLHVPGHGRLADPAISQGVRNLAGSYPSAQIVLAHCGRCYLPDEMKHAVSAIKDLENVYLDTAMVMDPTVLEILLEQIDSRRLLFATDLPIAFMRGRRVYVMDHWVDVVLEGYPQSSYRIQSNDIRATFMVYEIMLAIIRAGERIKLKEKEIKSIFHDNGMRIINRVSLPVS